MIIFIIGENRLFLISSFSNTINLLCIYSAAAMIVGVIIGGIATFFLEDLTLWKFVSEGLIFLRII